MFDDFRTSTQFLGSVRERERRRGGRGMPAVVCVCVCVLGCVCVCVCVCWGVGGGVGVFVLSERVCARMRRQKETILQKKTYLQI